MAGAAGHPPGGAPCRAERPARDGAGVRGLGELRPLDRYVVKEFWKIFVTTALGFPVLVIIIDVVDHLEKYLVRHLTAKQIALSYLYWIPDSMFLVLPAAVLFATVFSIGAFTRHSEITAAKASGVSFHRMVLPIFAASGLVMLLALALGELVPVTNAKRDEILEERKYRPGQNRFNFAYAAREGRVYKIGNLTLERGAIDVLEIERKGIGPDYPTILIAARTARWDTLAARWTLAGGTVHVAPDSVRDFAFEFDSLRDAKFTEAPVDLTALPRSPDQMRFAELRRFIHSLERSGGNVNELKVELSLKLAIPVTCLIIALFGAPLATSTQRGGTALGIGVSLATTILFLMLIQITKAVGQGGVIPPYLAAWLPSLLFGAVGTVLLTKVRT
jgi:lipopolysaccharide export system permease protein